MKSTLRKLNPKRIFNRFQYDTPSDHLILGVLFSGISVGLGAASKYIYEQLQYQKDSINWPACRGIITSVYYVRHRPVITYEYVAFGKQFMNQKINLKVASTYLNMEKMIQFRPESFVNVRYNIKNPQISCLIPSSSYDHWDVALFGILSTSCLTLGLFSLSRFRKYLSPKIHRFLKKKK
eukprot:gene4571-7955_t